jgi:hypothetical protein
MSPDLSASPPLCAYFDNVSVLHDACQWKGNEVADWSERRTGMSVGCVIYLAGRVVLLRVAITASHYVASRAQDRSYW